MPPALPDDLILLIIERISAEPRDWGLPILLSLSLTSSAFLTQCQKFIFSTVRLSPVYNSSERRQSLELMEKHRRSLLLIKSVLHNPGLGQYVRRLHYQVVSIPRKPEALAKLLLAIELMPCIEDLSLAASGQPSSVFLLRAPVLSLSDEPEASQELITWRHAMRGVIGRRCMRTLRLEKLKGIYIEHLSPGIQNLHLTCVELGEPRSSAPLFKEHLPSNTASSIELRTLTSDDLSLDSFVNKYLDSTGNEHPHVHRLDFSRIQTLKVDCHPFYELEALVTQATCLQTLEVSAKPRKSADILLPTSPRSILQDVHPSSFCTLSHLRIGTIIPFYNANSPPYDPYAHLCDDTLHNLVVLEHLEFGIDIYGHRNSYPDDFAIGQWRRMPDLLTIPGSLPKLQKLSIHICIRAMAPTLGAGGSTGRPSLEQLQDERTKELNRRNVSAEQLSEDLFKLICEPQFRPLLTARPNLDLSFVTEVVMAR